MHAWLSLTAGLRSCGICEHNYKNGLLGMDFLNELSIPL